MNFYFDITESINKLISNFWLSVISAATIIYVKTLLTAN